MFEPLYTAAEMRAVEERFPGYPDTVPELMERAGTALAREAMHAYPDVPAYPASHGCVRLSAPEAQRVYDFAVQGTPVDVY